MLVTMSAMLLTAAPVHVTAAPIALPGVGASVALPGAVMSPFAGDFQPVAAMAVSPLALTASLSGRLP